MNNNNSNNKNLQVFSSGISKVMTEHDGHRHIKEMDWQQDYDGNKANIHLSLNQDGQEIHRDYTVRNPDIDRLLSTPAVTKRLETRLLEDFLSGTNNSLFTKKTDLSRSIKKGKKNPVRNDRNNKYAKNNKSKKLKKMTKKRKLKTKRKSNMKK